jgi:hypothetical protein
VTGAVKAVTANQKEISAKVEMLVTQYGSLARK